MSSADLRAEAPIPLPGRCGTAAAKALHATLLHASDRGAAVRIDASEVSNLGRAAVQLLLAARADAEARGAAFELLSPSVHVHDTLDRCGLRDSLAPLAARSAAA